MAVVDRLESVEADHGENRGPGFEPSAQRGIKSNPVCETREIIGLCRQREHVFGKELRGDIRMDDPTEVDATDAEARQ